LDQRQEQIPIPAIVPGRRPIEWRLPTYNTLHHIMTNPVYAGAYAFGRRTAHVTITDGRKRTVRSRHRDPKAWDVLIKDHHDGYISWDEFERNQRLIADNANGKSFMSRGSLRRGEALLAVGAAGGSSMLHTAVRVAPHNATSAAARSISWPPIAASRLAACGSIVPGPFAAAWG
jgi:hypothetical protein